MSEAKPSKPDPDILTINGNDMWVIETREKSWIIHKALEDGVRFSTLPVVYMTKADNRLHPINTTGRMCFPNRDTLIEVDEDRLARIVSSRYTLEDLRLMVDKWAKQN